VRVLVTGGAGYIGSFTVQALLEAGHEVVAFDNLSHGHRTATPVELVTGDLADPEALNACLARGFDAVMHFAAFIEAGDSMVDAARFFRNNTGNSITLLNALAANGIKQLVFSSTAGVYGNPERLPIKESDPTAPTNVYAESKLLVERMLPWYERVYGIRSVALRYFNAAGAAPDGSNGQDHEPASHLIAIAIQAAMGVRHGMTVFGTDYPTDDGTCIRDYIHVIDLAAAHVLALDHLSNGTGFDVFNVGSGRGYSVWDVVGEVKRVSRVDFPVEVGPRRAGDPVALIADPSKLRDRLGWSTKSSGLDTIVSSAWEWHSTHPGGYEG
jgi:UDP-glucose 4-epimerase